MTIEKTLRELQHWMELEGIEGIAQGLFNNKPCITVFSSLPEAGKSLSYPSRNDQQSIVRTIIKTC